MMMLVQDCYDVFSLLISSTISIFISNLYFVEHHLSSSKHLLLFEFWVSETLTANSTLPIFTVPILSSHPRTVVRMCAMPWCVFMSLIRSLLKFSTLRVHVYCLNFYLFCSLIPQY